MQETGNKDILDKRMRLTIRISNHKIWLGVPDPQAQQQVVYEAIDINNGISIAANLRDAFNKSELLMSNYRHVQILLDTPVMLIPVEEFDEEHVETLYQHTFCDHQDDALLHNVLPGLKSIAVYSINSDLQQVVNDHFEDIRFMPVCQPVWMYLHHRSFTGPRPKLFVYFNHDDVNVFAFRQNRFHYCNTFHADSPADITYYILYVWKTLGMNTEKDELYAVGQYAEKNKVMDGLRKYLQRAYPIHPSAEFNRAPITQINDIPFDLITLFLAR